MPKNTDLSQALIGAMDVIEADYVPPSGVLPKEYTIFEDVVLEDLLLAKIVERYPYKGNHGLGAESPGTLARLPCS